MMTYEQYHEASMEAGDVDPAYDMLRYVCDRFELNIEQRYWLAFLYATCYCGPTVYYFYNEFPDFENVDFGRMERWWNANRSKLVFQSDRRWTRSRNQWVDQVRSYREVIGSLTQARKFACFDSGDPYQSYAAAWDEMLRVKNFGRFSMFLYLEAVHVVTGFPMAPASMDINKDNESCRGGLLYAIGRDELVDLPLPRQTWLQIEFDGLISRLRAKDQRNNVWNAETTLCAYRKYRIGKRWVGYYRERLFGEILKMEQNVKQGVDWSVLKDWFAESQPKEIRECESLESAASPPAEKAL